MIAAIKRIPLTLKRIPTWLILTIVTGMLLLHVIGVGIYAKQHNSTQMLARRDAAIQQIMNIVHMVEATPIQQLPRALEAVDDPNLKVDITTDPAWKFRPSNLSFWEINRLVPENVTTIEMSLPLVNGNWLNIQVYLAPPAWMLPLLMIAFEAIIAFVILFYVWSINRFTKPLNNFRNAAERLGVDLHAPQLEEYSGPQIIRDTAQAMNRMQKRIKDLLDDRTEMLAAISHDLRTPLTRLKLRANLFQDEEVYKKTIRDIDEMNLMIGEILAFSRNDNSKEKTVKLELNSLLQSICDDLADMGLPVSFYSKHLKVPFDGRTVSLKRAFTNLIQNAVNYGEVARVELNKQRNKITITIDDDGPGIPEAEQKKVFSPFYRCDQSRSREVGGTGLGLAVARDAILTHHGEINLQNRPEGGLRVTITL